MVAVGHDPNAFSTKQICLVDFHYRYSLVSVCKRQHNKLYKLEVHKKYTTSTTIMRVSSFILPVTVVAIFTKPSTAQPQSLNSTITTNLHDATASSASSYSFISLNLFNQIMATEVRTEVDLMAQEEANEMWNAAILHQWTVAEEREELAAVNNDQDRRATLGLLPPGTSPFLVCDLTYGKSGDACKQTVEEALGGSEHQLMVSTSDITDTIAHVIDYVVLDSTRHYFLCFTFFAPLHDSLYTTSLTLLALP
jgi:hypothetical protein